MDVLKELVHIVTKNKIKSVKLLDEELDSLGKVGELYENILNGAFQTDDEAAGYFYPSSPWQKSNYRKLKSDLYNRLVNTLFFIDVQQSAYTDRKRAHQECYRNWAAANILLGKNARTASVDLSHKVLKYALKYEFSDLVLPISRWLRLHYGSRVGDARKFDEYRKLYRDYEEICRVESLAEELYTDLVLNYVNNKATKRGVQDKAREYYEELADAMSRWKSYKLHLYGSLIHLMVFTSVGDYQGTIEVAKGFIRFFEAKPYEAFTPLQIGYYQLLVCYIQLRRFEEGKEAAEKCLSFLEEGAFNWFKYYEMYFTLCMHTRRYQEGYEIFRKISDHPRFRFLPESILEVWKIYEAHLHYLINANLVEKASDDQYFTKFRLGRFLNETPIFSKDKRGLNIAILSIQILFLIQQKKYGKAIDKFEAIEKYCYRYLHQEETIRSYYFIQLLMTIPDAEFHQAGVTRKGKKYLDRLRSVPLEASSQNHKIEIIPYEDLWEMISGNLDRRFARHSSLKYGSLKRS